jgi:hypothetical protein
MLFNARLAWVLPIFKHDQSQPRCFLKIAHLSSDQKGIESLSSNGSTALCFGAAFCTGFVAAGAFFGLTDSE